MKYKPVTKTTTQNNLAGMRAGGEHSAGPLLKGVIHEFQVGEERRCLACFAIDELAPRAFIAIPKALQIIGGHNLLWDRPERNIPISGMFGTLAAVSDAAKAWATAFNETQI